MMAPIKPLSRRTRLLLSGLLLGHLLAVVLPPLSFQTRGPLGTSPSIASLFAWFEPYSQWLYIDRGYAFFAPDPGPSHLVQAAITDSDGERLEIVFPDRTVQWPRLSYHRHFMLTEFLEEIYQPPGPPPELNELDPAEAQYWLGARARYERIRQSYIEHLRHMYPGRQVEVRRVEHLIPEILEFQQRPIELTDDSLYRPMLDLPVVLEFDAENLPAVEDASANGRVGASAERRFQADMPADLTVPASRSVPASDTDSVSGESR
ncbi:MAG: hypothetical protein ACPGLY_01595 [Rubripirellula sp.]